MHAFLSINAAPRLGHASEQATEEAADQVASYIIRANQRDQGSGDLNGQSRAPPSPFRGLLLLLLKDNRCHENNSLPKRYG